MYCYGRKMQFAITEMKCTQYNLKEFIILNISPKISHNVQGFRHYIVDIRKFCEYSVIRYWHHTEFTSGRRIRIWTLKQNGRNAWLKVQYLVISYPNENMPHLYLYVSTENSSFSRAYVNKTVNTHYWSYVCVIYQWSTGGFSSHGVGNAKRASIS